MMNKLAKLYQPIIIIGAGRSGTNMLRDILTQLPKFGTWPCDEINYIWRHGNLGEPNDEFSPELATENVGLFIRKKFDQLARSNSLNYVVEKTCANSLRVGFVHKIFPDAKFIHIVRDGRDVVVSAQKRWTASLDLNYILRKARFVPISDLPYYALRYFGNRLYRLSSKENRLASWGPHFIGMEEILQQYSLPEICAIQWQRCVEKADLDLSSIPKQQVFIIRYEDFVKNPNLELQKICDFLEIEVSEEIRQKLIRKVSNTSVGQWSKELDDKTIQSVQKLLQKTLIKYQYL